MASSSRKRPYEDCKKEVDDPPDAQNIDDHDVNEKKPDIRSLAASFDQQQQQPKQETKTEIKTEVEQELEIELNKRVKKEEEKKEQQPRKNELCACSPNYACCSNYASSSSFTTFSSYAHSMNSAGSSNDAHDKRYSWSNPINVIRRKLELRHFVSKNSTRVRDELDDLFDEMNEPL